MEYEIAINSVRLFICSYWSDHPKIEKLADNDDLFAYFNYEGDYASEFMEAFDDEFDVNFNNYLWYFHQQDEPPGRNFANLIIKRPWMRVDRIPVTVLSLTNAILAKEWCVNYPNHDISIPVKEKILGGGIYIVLPLTLLAWLYSVM